MNILRFTPQTEELDLRRSILECGRIIYDRGLTISNDGNISVRVDDNHVLITPSGLCKGRMDLDDLLLLDMDGNIVGTNATSGLVPSSETPMHLEVYHQRPDVRAVLHAHPIFATTLTVADLELPTDMLPEVLLTMGKVPISRYATPSSDDDADAIRELVKEYDVIMLRQHGSLTLGSHLDETLIHLERLEHVAEVYWRARMLGHVARIPEESQAHLLAVRAKWMGEV